MKILVTGATGFIGRHVIEPLQELGFEVHATSRIRGDAAAHWHEANLFDAHARRRLLEAVQPTHLMHLAWNAVPGQFWTTRENVQWLESSMALIDEFLVGGGRSVVIAGTCAEYLPTDQPCIEDVTPVVPSTLYAESKHSLHVAARSLCDSRSAPLAWGRIFQPYGPFEPRARVVPTVITSLLANAPARCTTGEQVRDFIFVDDCATAFAMLAARGADGAFNIGTGAATRLADVLVMVAEALGKPELLQLGSIPSRPGEAPSIYADGTRLRSIGWAPRSLASGIALTIEWWRGQRGSGDPLAVDA